MTKRRVYELARDYGMKGPEFVRVLKDLGFEKVKTHMAVLDDADQMVIEVRMESAGFERAVQAKPTEAKPTVKNAPVRKSLKKKLGADDETTTGGLATSTDTATLTPRVPTRKKATSAAAPADEQMPAYTDSAAHWHYRTLKRIQLDGSSERRSPAPDDDVRRVPDVARSNSGGCSGPGRAPHARGSGSRPLAFRRPDPRCQLRAAAL